MMKQTRKMLLLLALLIPAGAMAQDNEQAIQKSRPAKVHKTNGHRLFVDGKEMKISQ